MNLTSSILYLAFTMLLTTNSFAQHSFERMYGGDGYDRGESVQQTTDGGYVIVGSTRSFGAGLNDVYLIKTNSLGDTIWTKTYGGVDSDVGRSLQQTADGGYIIVGHTKSFGAGDLDVYLIKTNVSGDTVWTKTFGGSDWDIGESVQQTSDGGYIIAGLTRSFGEGIYDVYVIKTDGSGDTLWTRTYGGTDNDQGKSILETTDEGYIIAGLTRSFGAGDYDVYLIRIDTSGDTLWTRTYGDTLIDQGFSVQQTMDGGYIIAGETVPLETEFYDFYLIKTNASGDTLWTRTYGGPDEDAANFVRQTLDGGFILLGYTYSFGAGGGDIYLIKTDSSGDTLWTRTYGDSLGDVGYAVQQTTDGGYIITGVGEPAGTPGNSDVFLIKIEDPVLGIDESGRISSHPKNFNLLQNFPNPFNPVTTIRFSLPYSCDITLKIYNTVGEEVATLVNNELSSGSYKIDWDASNFASGVYFYRLHAGEFTETKKLILLR